MVIKLNRKSMKLLIIILKSERKRSKNTEIEYNKIQIRCSFNEVQMRQKFLRQVRPIGQNQDLTDLNKAREIYIFYIDDIQDIKERNRKINNFRSAMNHKDKFNYGMYLTTIILSVVVSLIFSGFVFQSYSTFYLGSESADINAFF